MVCLFLRFLFIYFVILNCKSMCFHEFLFIGKIIIIGWCLEDWWELNVSWMKSVFFPFSFFFFF
ncbi:hypothetical protein DsansV1_C38g0235011 [Dioscorea sansibarensis]